MARLFRQIGLFLVEFDWMLGFDNLDQLRNKVLEVAQMGLRLVLLQLGQIHKATPSNILQLRMNLSYSLVRCKHEQYIY